MTYPRQYPTIWIVRNHWVKIDHSRGSIEGAFIDLETALSVCEPRGKPIVSWQAQSIMAWQLGLVGCFHRMSTLIVGEDRTPSMWNWNPESYEERRRCDGGAYDGSISTQELREISPEALNCVGINPLDFWAQREGCRLSRRDHMIKLSEDFAALACSLAEQSK